MAKVYYRKIKAGELTIEDVPMRWRAQVQALLDADEWRTDRKAIGARNSRADQEAYRRTDHKDNGSQRLGRALDGKTE